jgi:hypothetical protein
MANSLTEGMNEGYINYTSSVDGKEYSIEVTPEMDPK